MSDETKQRDDGGSATGQSRRDWLAGLAMQAELCGSASRESADDQYESQDDYDGLSGWAYAVADAMIAEGRK